MDRRLLVLALGMLALGTDSFVVAGILPEIAQEFGVGIGAAAQLTTVYALAFAVLAPVIATLAANIDRKRLLVAGLVIFIVANVGTAAAPSLALALITRAFAGLGAAMFSPTATGAAAAIVPPERRGFALSVVIAGMTVSTALGSPIGALIGGAWGWRWSMLFVAGLATASGLSVLVFLSHIPKLPAIGLKQRLSPLADARIGLTLATTFLFFAAAFTIYTYFSVVFAAALGDDPQLLGLLLMVWGLAGTASNLLAGRLIDRLGNRRVLTVFLLCVLLDFVLLPWTSPRLSTAIPAVVLWGACGWGILVPQQHRIVGIAPSVAPIILGLNNSATFLGATAAGVIGAATLPLVGPNGLGIVAAVLVAAALIAAELAGRAISRRAGDLAATAAVQRAG